MSTSQSTEGSFTWDLVYNLVTLVPEQGVGEVGVDMCHLKFHKKNTKPDCYWKYNYLSITQWRTLLDKKSIVSDAFLTHDDVDIHLGSGEFIKSTIHNGKMYVHLRQYWIPKDGVTYKGTKRSISMDHEGWNCLISSSLEINMAIDGIHQNKALDYYSQLECQMSSETIQTSDAQAETVPNGDAYLTIDQISDLTKMRGNANRPV